MTNGLEWFLLCHVSYASHKQSSTDLKVNDNSGHNNCYSNTNKEKSKNHYKLDREIVLYCHYY